MRYPWIVRYYNGAEGYRCRAFRTRKLAMQSARLAKQWRSVGVYHIVSFDNPDSPQVFVAEYSNGKRID